MRYFCLKAKSFWNPDALPRLKTLCPRPAFKTRDTSLKFDQIQKQSAGRGWSGTTATQERRLLLFPYNWVTPVIFSPRIRSLILKRLSKQTCPILMQLLRCGGFYGLTERLMSHFPLLLEESLCWFISWSTDCWGSGSRSWCTRIFVPFSSFVLTRKSGDANWETVL